MSREVVVNPGDKLGVRMLNSGKFCGFCAYHVRSGSSVCNLDIYVHTGKAYRKEAHPDKVRSDGYEASKVWLQTPFSTRAVETRNDHFISDIVGEMVHEYSIIVWENGQANVIFAVDECDYLREGSDQISNEEMRRLFEKHLASVTRGMEKIEL